MRSTSSLTAVRPGLVVVVSVVVVFSGWYAQAEPATYVWLDADDKPLPFQDFPAIQEALRSARVLEKQAIGRGVAGAVKLVLEYEDTRFHAVFRMVDISKREDTASARIIVRYRDAAIFEMAAYVLSERLGIHRVPPTVVRRIDGLTGTVQAWMEETDAEDELLEVGPIQPPDPKYWWRQKSSMWVFDSLIANVDRNQGNILIDEHWNLWLIDHTRAFKQTTELLEVAKIKTCDRQLWTAIQQLDETTLRQILGPYLESREISKTVLRQEKLVKHIKKQIKKRGEEKVLFDSP